MASQQHHRQMDASNAAFASSTSSSAAGNGSRDSLDITEIQMRDLSNRTKETRISDVALMSPNTSTPLSLLALQQQQQLPSLTSSSAISPHQHDFIQASSSPSSAKVPTLMHTSFQSPSAPSTPTRTTTEPTSNFPLKPTLSLSRKKNGNAATGIKFTPEFNMNMNMNTMMFGTSIPPAQPTVSLFRWILNRQSGMVINVLTTCQRDTPSI
jgi:hypothetical protein